MGEEGVVAAGQPDEVLALALVGGDAVHSEEVDDVLGVDAVGEFAVHLAEDLALVEVARADQSFSLVFELRVEGGTSSWE